MDGCHLHKLHRPAALTTEEHHIVPQAWQHVTSDRLWAPTTVTLCPTSHRNVHFWMVRMMKWLKNNNSTDPDAAFRSLGTRTPEAKVALDGIKQYAATGRPLASLLAFGLFGYA